VQQKTTSGAAHALSRQSVAVIVSTTTLRDHTSPLKVIGHLTKPGTAKQTPSEAAMSSSFLPVVPPTYFTSQLTPEITIAVIISVLIASAVSVIFLRNRRLPPMNQESMLGTVGIFMIGKGSPEFLYSTMKKLGLVYRLRMPETTPWIVVCDPALAQTILTTESEKPALYQRFAGANNGSQTLFSRKTSDIGWHHARKGMAPSFSMANLCLSMPIMYAKINQLKAIMIEKQLNGTTIEVDRLMTQMTMDFICAGMCKRLHVITLPLGCSMLITCIEIALTCRCLYAAYLYDSYVRYRLRNYAIKHIRWSHHDGKYRHSFERIRFEANIQSVSILNVLEC
jgi:Cytochrome P450